MQRLSGWLPLFSSPEEPLQDSPHKWWVRHSENQQASYGISPRSSPDKTTLCKTPISQRPAQPIISAQLSRLVISEQRAMSDLDHSYSESKLMDTETDVSTVRSFISIASPLYENRRGGGTAAA